MGLKHAVRGVCDQEARQSGEQPSHGSRLKSSHSSTHSVVVSMRGSGIMGMDSLVYGGEPGTIYDFIRERRERGDGRRSEMAGRRRKDIPPLSALIDHIDHIVRLVGVDHVCISSDWGGYPVNIQGIENAGEYQNIARALLKRGYGRNEVAKVMGENLLRVFDQVTSIRN